MNDILVDLGRFPETFIVEAVKGGGAKVVSHPVYKKGQVVFQ